jgi:hypothetical protein
MFASVSDGSDKSLVKRFDNLERFLKKLSKTKDFWCREVFTFFNIPLDKQV